MQTRTKLYIAGSLGIAALTAVSFLPASSPQARYSPRHVEASQSIAGAQEYLHMLRANGVTGEIDPALVA